MKRKIIYLAVFIIIFIAGAMTGIIFAGYHTSKALKLLTYNEVVKGYDDVQLAYRTNNPELIIWELEHFNLLLDKIESYKVIEDAEFYFYKIIIYALFDRYSNTAENKKNVLYKKTMLDYFELYSKTRNKPLDRGEIDSFINRILEDWKNKVIEDEK